MSCGEQVRARRWDLALRTCTANLAATGEPEAALGAARSALYLARYDEVPPLATAALRGPHVGDAHMLIGAARFALGDQTEGDPATQRAHFAAALAHLSAAFAVHVAAADVHGVVSDTQQLASLRRELGDYEAALALATLSCRAATRSSRRGLLVSANVALADILREVGRLEEGERVLDAIDERSLDAFNRVWVLLKRGVLHLDAGEWRLARAPLERGFAEERAARVPRPDLLEALALNLAFVERKAGAFARALAYLEDAHAAGAGPMSYHLNRGLVLADAGRLDEAAADLAAAEDAGPTGQWAPWVSFQRGVVARRRGDDALAAASFRRAIDALDELARGSGAWAPTMIARNREPHLALIGLHASRGEWHEVLGVVARMDAQALLVSTARASEPPPSSLDPPQRITPHAALLPVAQIVAAWQGRRLVVIVPGGTRLWRLEVDPRGLRGVDVGDREELAALALRLESHPLDLDAGRRLGEALLPADAAPGMRLEVLAIGPIARAPLAALRYRTESALARWPLLRVAGVLPRAAHHGERVGAVFVADPIPPGAGFRLPAARAAALAAADRLGGGALVGAQATRAQFGAALRDAAWLQIATRTGRSAEGQTIVLHDGELSARDIAASVAPAVVVLASCDTAIGDDDAGNGSLANAFLDAGAQTVIATRWLIEDAEAARVMAAFYAHDALRDPIAALRAVQLAPGDLPARAWAAFEVQLARPTAP